MMFEQLPSAPHTWDSLLTSDGQIWKSSGFWNVAFALGPVVPGVAAIVKHHHSQAAILLSVSLVAIWGYALHGVVTQIRTSRKGIRSSSFANREFDLENARTRLWRKQLLLGGIGVAGGVFLMFLS